jgi:uncharacterized protein involved in exopolysaccharide biosynthesis
MTQPIHSNLPESRLPTMAYPVADDEIDLAELFRALWLGRWWIIGCGFLCTTLAIGIALWLPDSYRAEATLAPSAEQQGGGLSALAGQFGGLASLAGINLGGGGSDKVGLAIEVAKSRQFVANFIQHHQLAVPLMATLGANKLGDEVRIDPSSYNEQTDTWVRDVKPPKHPKPSNWEMYKEFSKLISLEQDKKSGLVTVGVEYYSPEVAKQWVDWLVADLNRVMKQKDIDEAQRNIAYLTMQLEKTPVADMQTVFYKLIEEQTKTLMLAEVNQEYVFKTLDPAVVPEEKAKPKRALIVVLGGILGGMLGVMLVLLRHALRRERKQISN